MMGGGFQFLDLVFFGLIAVFLILRLRNVLGRRDGHEGNYEDRLSRRDKAAEQDNNVIPLAPRTDSAAPDSPGDDGANDGAAPSEAPDGILDETPLGAGPLGAGLAQILIADPTFASNEFASGARIAFDLVFGAYAAGDIEALEPLLSDEVHANFASAIQSRNEAGDILTHTLVGIASTDIVEAYMDGTVASITVKFVSDQIQATHDKDGSLIDGDPQAVTQVTDFWTFARDTQARDPNWTLVATHNLD